MLAIPSDDVAAGIEHSDGKEAVDREGLEIGPERRKVMRILNAEQSNAITLRRLAKRLICLGKRDCLFFFSWRSHG